MKRWTYVLGKWFFQEKLAKDPVVFYCRSETKLYTGLPFGINYFKHLILIVKSKIFRADADIYLCTK